MNRLHDTAIVLQNLPKVDLASDPFDNYLLGLAEAGQAHFLVTGDGALLGLKSHKSARIVTPTAFLGSLKGRGAKQKP